MEAEKNKVNPSTLYIVGTPIGNLADISERAKKVLSTVDFIAAEDTRNTLKLLHCYGIQKETVSYHEHNKKSAGDYILGRLLTGESCALVTDAGMPAISDPGEDLVALAAENGITVSVIPGACAAVSALAVSGLPTRYFAFEGFLPVGKKEREERLCLLAGETRTVIVYEAPHKLKGTLDDLCRTLGGERRISLCRELTKLNEDIQRTTLAEAVACYAEKEPRGEYVLILEGGCPKVSEPDAEIANLSPKDLVAHFESTGLPRMDAIKAAAKSRGMSKSDFYKLLQ